MRKGRVIVTMTIEYGDGSETSGTHALVFDDPNGMFPTERLAEAISDCADGIKTPRLDSLLAQVVTESQAMNRLPKGSAGLVAEADRVNEFWRKYDEAAVKSRDGCAERLAAYLSGNEIGA